MSNELEEVNLPENCNILVVEDDDADLFILKKHLEEIWPESSVIVATSLQEAYDIYRKIDIDMVLLDLNLPDGFGAHTVKELRKIVRNIPIIVTTGVGTNNLVYESLKLGANNVVLKSQITDNDFVNILDQNINKP